MTKEILIFRQVFCHAWFVHICQPEKRTDLRISFDSYRRDVRVYLGLCMDDQIAGQRFSDTGPLTLLAALSTWQPRDPRPQALKTTSTALIFSISASSTRSRFRLIAIPSQNGSVRSLQQGPLAPG